MIKKLKVLYIITKSDIGGAQKYVKDLSSHLDKDRFETKILYGGDSLKWLSNTTKPWLLFINDWMALFELVRAYKKANPDVIHLNSSKAGVIGSLAARIYKNISRKNVKVVFTAHGWVFNPTNHISAFAQRFYILLHRFGARSQDTIINVSQHDHRLAIQYNIAPKNKLITIHNGINTNLEFLTRDIAREAISKNISILNNWPWIGSIGRLTKEKNYETLIDAASRTPNAYFFIIGTGDEKEKLIKKIHSEKMGNRFFLVSPKGDDAQYLKAFDIFAMSSIKEGLPYTLLEAMLAGTRIVVTKTGGMPEAIQNSINGLIVPAKNPTALHNALQTLLKKENISLGEKAKKDVEEKFSLLKMVEKTSEIYS